jgi:hypothetical protein
MALVVQLGRNMYVHTYIILALRLISPIYVHTYIHAYICIYIHT